MSDTLWLIAVFFCWVWIPAAAALVAWVWRLLCRGADVLAVHVTRGRALAALAVYLFVLILSAASVVAELRWPQIATAEPGHVARIPLSIPMNGVEDLWRGENLDVTCYPLRIGPATVPVPLSNVITQDYRWSDRIDPDDVKKRYREGRLSRTAYVAFTLPAMEELRGRFLRVRVAMDIVKPLPIPGSSVEHLGTISILKKQFLNDTGPYLGAQPLYVPTARELQLHRVTGASALASILIMPLLSVLLCRVVYFRAFRLKHS